MVIDKKTSDVSALIMVGLSTPSFYKRSVWNAATKIMDFLCDNTSDVERANGMTKYKITSTLSLDKINELANKFISKN